MSTFFLFPDSGLNLLNGFDFFILIYFDWRDTENQQFVVFIFTSITSFVLFLLYTTIVPFVRFL